MTETAIGPSELRRHASSDSPDFRFKLSPKSELILEPERVRIPSRSVARVGQEGESRKLRNMDDRMNNMDMWMTIDTEAIH